MTIVNRAAMNIGVYVSFQIRVFSVYVTRSGVAGLYGSSKVFFFFYFTFVFNWRIIALQYCVGFYHISA